MDERPPDAQFRGRIDGVPFLDLIYDSHPAVVFAIEDGNPDDLRALMQEAVEVTVRKVDGGHSPG